jgi:putative ABC transport system ATP-binding protein
MMDAIVVPPLNQNVFRVEDVRFSYLLGAQKVEALKGVSFDLKEGSVVCISGPSGSGKSTLLNLLGLIEDVQSGDISFRGVSFKGLGEKEKNRIRKFDIGFIFQSFHLFPVLTAEENVEYFLSRQGIARAERKARAREALASVGLADHSSKRPLEMSGGQRQRVAVARALAKRPSVIIADEPTASLDQRTGQDLMELFLRLNREHNLTLLISSHDPMVQATCPQSLRLRDGVLT